METSPATRALGGRYDILRELGRGGMGIVFEAFDRVSGGVVALKLLPEGAGAFDVEGYRRFEREADALRRVTHPNLVALLDFQARPGEPAFLVMERLEGMSLREMLLHQPRLAVAEACAIAAGVLSALGAAHARGMVHRDVKPANVFLCVDGRVKLLDFGIVKVLEGAGSVLTASGAMLGTPGYMAPEQVLSSQISPAADLFSLAVCLFEMLAGRRLFEGRSAALRAVVRETPLPRLDANDPNIPSPLASLVESALARDPAARPASAAAMLNQLLRIVPGALAPLPVGVVRASRSAAGDAHSPLVTEIVVGQHGATEHDPHPSTERLTPDSAPMTQRLPQARGSSRDGR